MTRLPQAFSVERDDDARLKTRPFTFLEELDDA